MAAIDRELGLTLHSEKADGERQATVLALLNRPSGGAIRSTCHDLAWMHGGETKTALSGEPIRSSDNCRVHLGPAIGEAIEKAQARLRYLPKYSPDLNPIEMPYSKFKTLLRQVAARTVPALNRAIRSFIPQLSPKECANYFRHAGVLPNDRNQL